MTEEEKAQKELLKIAEEKGYVTNDDICHAVLNYFVQKEQLESFLRHQGIKVCEQVNDPFSFGIDEKNDYGASNEELQLDEIKNLLLKRVKPSGIIDQRDIYEILSQFEQFELDDDTTADLINFFREKGIEVCCENDVDEDDLFESTELDEYNQNYYDDKETDDLYENIESDDCFDEEFETNEIDYYNNNKNPETVFQELKESENALKIKNDQWVFLGTTELGGIDYIFGGTYSYKVGLLVSVNEQSKTFKVGLMIGNGDSIPASPIPCYLSEKDSIDFVLKWVSKNEYNAEYALESLTKYDYYLLKKQIKKQFSSKIQEIHTILDDGTPYYDRIVPDEIELIEDIDNSRLNCLLPKHLELHCDETNIWLSCEAGATSNYEKLRWTDFSMLLWALKKLFVER